MEEKMGCGCGKKNTNQVAKQAAPVTKQASGSQQKTPLQTRKERVNKLVAIPGTKPK